MLEVENFLDQNTFDNFLHLAERVNETPATPCVKTNWYYTTDGLYGVHTRFSEKKGNFRDTRFSENDSRRTRLHPDFEDDLQIEIRLALKSFLENYTSKIQQVGKNFVSPNFNISHIKLEFQYTDVLKSHVKHKHNEDLIGTIYISPKVAKGTVFFQDETYIVPWKPNKCSFHTKNIFHLFENDTETDKRFTINFFVTSDN